MTRASHKIKSNHRADSILQGRPFLSSPGSPISTSRPLAHRGRARGRFLLNAKSPDGIRLTATRSRENKAVGAGAENLSGITSLVETAL